LLIVEDEDVLFSDSSLPSLTASSRQRKVCGLPPDRL
jgi:hypothetical protein